MNKLLCAASEDIRKVVLANGATLLTQIMPGSLSVSVGVWVRSGSRDEVEGENGITHFLEHMVFKGSKRRSALDLALAMDRLGGQFDAYTTKELTSFSARVLAEYSDTAFETLSELIHDPLFDPEMMALEKQVVLEEIRNVLDEPDDLVFEFAATEIFGAHPLAGPILGSEDSVSSFTPADLRDWLTRKYVARNMIIAVAGPLSHDELLEKVETSFLLRTGEAQERPGNSLPEVERRIHVVPKDLNQQHIWIGRLGMSSSHPDRYVLSLLSTLLGGSMSSRLFQAIRERAGLAYNVFNFCDFASDAGITGTYMAVSPARSEEAIRRVLDEYVKLIVKGCGEDELDDIKMQLKSNMLLGLENVTARMYRLARMELNEGRYISVQELVDRIDSVGVEDIRRIAAEYLDPDRQSLISLGPSASTGPF